MTFKGFYMMYRKSVLNANPRVIFDPTDDGHMKTYASFVKNKNWQNGCPFFLEDPYNDVPTLINEKIVQSVLKPLI